VVGDGLGDEDEVPDEHGVADEEEDVQQEGNSSRRTKPTRRLIHTSIGK